MKLYNYLKKRLVWWWKRHFKKPMPTPTKVNCVMCEKLVDPFILSDECLCVRCQTEVSQYRRTRRALMIPAFPHCPRCDLELNPGMSTQKTLDGYCPRCAYDIDGTIDITADYGEVITQEQIDDWKGMNEFNTLVLILSNWLDGYMKAIDRDGLDWSIPHEFLQEFAEQMVPYISRLKATGYATPERMLMIGDMVANAIHNLVERLKSEEDLMRLTGQWTDTEQEIKDHWEKQGGINANLRISM